jgi:hypothetical protein
MDRSLKRETAKFGEPLENEHMSALTRSRAKLVEQRRALAKRDSSSDRNEGYAERIVSIQAAIEATERAIADEQKLRDDDARRVSGAA